MALRQLIDDDAARAHGQRAGSPSSDEPRTEAEERMMAELAKVRMIEEARGRAA